MRSARPLVACLLVATLAGCAAPSDAGVVAERQSHRGGEVVASGGLSILQGALYEMDGGALRLSPEPGVIVDGVLDVRGALVLRDVEVSGLLRLVAHPGSTLLLDNVTIVGGPAWPTLVVRTDGARITGSRLDVHRLDIAGDARVEGNRVRGDSASPSVLWRDGNVVLRGNRLESPGHGILMSGATGVVEDNVVLSGGADGSAGIAAVGSMLTMARNRVEGAEVGISLARTGGLVAENEVRDTGSVAIALLRSRATVADNVVERPGRAGIALDEAPEGVRVEGNRVTGATGPKGSPGAGIALRAASAIVERNVVTGNDVGVLVVSGAPAVRGNDFGGNRLYGLLRNVTPENGARPLDATGNWWGAASGPVPDATGAAEAPPPRLLGADRVGPGVRFAPWSPEPGPTSGAVR